MLENPKVPFLASVLASTRMQLARWRPFLFTTPTILKHTPLKHFFGGRGGEVPKGLAHGNFCETQFCLSSSCYNGSSHLLLLPPAAVAISSSLQMPYYPLALAVPLLLQGECRYFIIAR